MRLPSLQNLTLLSLKELLVRSLVSMRDARKEKEKVELKLKKINERLSGLKLEIAREVAETLDKSGKPLYSNEIKRTLARREKEVHSRLFQKLSKDKTKYQARQRTLDNSYSDLVNLRISLGHLVTLAAVEPRLFRKTSACSPRSRVSFKASISLGVIKRRMPRRCRCSHRSIISILGRDRFSTRFSSASLMKFCFLTL